MKGSETRPKHRLKNEALRNNFEGLQDKEYRVTVQEMESCYFLTVFDEKADGGSSYVYYNKEDIENDSEIIENETNLNIEA